MKRLIDEEDAIRAICKNCYAEDGGDYKDCRYYPCDDVQAIEALPSTGVERIKDIMKKANEQEKHMGRPTDLIRRADAIDAVQTYLDILINSRHHGDDFTFINVLTDIRNNISALPSADAVSRKAKCCPIAETCMSIDCPVSSEYIGRPSAEAVQCAWIWRTDIPIGDGRTSAGYICSNCGKDYWHGNVFTFCPNCGARMKGGAE